MRRKQWLAVAATAVVAAALVVLAGRYDQRRSEQTFALLDRYCTECHNPIDLAGELSFEGLRPTPCRSTPSTSRPPSGSCAAG